MEDVLDDFPFGLPDVELVLYVKKKFFLVDSIPSMVLRYLSLLYVVMELDSEDIDACFF